MKPDLSKFPLKAEDLSHPVEGYKAQVVNNIDLQELLDCWHQLHGEKALRVQVSYIPITGHVLIGKEEPFNCTLVLDEEKAS